MEVLKQWIRRFDRPVMILGAAAGLTAILMSLEFNLLEANLYDFRMSRGIQPTPSEDIVLVTLDDQTTKALNEFSPLPLNFHTRFVEALKSYEPKAVGYLVDMNRVNQLNPEMFRADWGTRFVQSAQELEARGIPFLMGTPFDVTGEVLPPYPLSALPHSVAVIHKDGNVFAEDKITRRALTHLYRKPVFHTELTQKLGYLDPGKFPRGTFYVPEVDGHYFFFRYHGNTALDLGLPYQTVSFLEVLEGKVDPRLLNGKILLVGTLTRENSSDYAFTPYAKTSFVNPKLGVHANILDSLIHDNGIRRVPSWINWILTLLVTAFVFWWVLKSTPLSGLFATLSLAVSFLAFSMLVFGYYGIWIRLSQPIVGILLGYYLVVPYRLILEYKKRWDYQRKNELLVQVEELKTNFLQLVTHDLKTPVARIQGLAEVLLRKASDRLIAAERETVNHIIDATDELNRFITSILELNKVESNRLHLQLESRDLNQLLERCVERFRPQSRAAGIGLKVELEPLFPIKLDASLVSKVIANLIDNALKYSPEGSEIRIETREIGQWVELSVTDQGIGMSEEEVEQLFTRFYRAKNDTTTRVSGTGLGLYLTKYFVEAHHGVVEVQSERGRGSTFKIKLPIESQIEGDLSENKGLTRRWVGAQWMQRKKERAHV